MIVNTQMGRRWALALGVTAAVIGISAAKPAEAYWHHGWGWGPRVTLGLGVPYGYGFYPYGYGYAYAPPPVYYAPPPAYYGPGGYYSRSSVTTTSVHKSTSTTKHHVTHHKPEAVCPAPAPSNSTSTQPAAPGPQASAAPQGDPNSAY
jgi:hypothetical protein